MDQGKGAAKSGPKDTTEIDSVLQSLSSHEILAQTKIDIMQQAVVKYHEVSIPCKGIQMQSLLDQAAKSL